MSMQRAPGPPEEATRGSSMNFPFWPGGFDEPEDALSNFHQSSAVCIDFENNLLTIPPGFTNGLEFKTDSEIKSKDETQPIDLNSIVDQENDRFGIWNKSNENQPQLTSLFRKLDVNDQLDESLYESKSSAPIIEISTSETKKIVKADWAEIIGNFNTLTNSIFSLPTIFFSSRCKSTTQRFFKLYS